MQIVYIWIKSGATLQSQLYKLLFGFYSFFSLSFVWLRKRYIEEEVEKNNDRQIVVVVYYLLTYERKVENAVWLSMNLRMNIPSPHWNRLLRENEKVYLSRKERLRLSLRVRERVRKRKKNERENADGRERERKWNRDDMKQNALNSFRRHQKRTWWTIKTSSSSSSFCCILCRWNRTEKKIWQCMKLTSKHKSRTAVGRDIHAHVSFFGANSFWFIVKNNKREIIPRGQLYFSRRTTKKQRFNDGF